MPHTVRASVRRKLRHHLENPPSYCLCNRFDSVDRLRLRLIDKLRDEELGP